MRTTLAHVEKLATKRPCWHKKCILNVWWNGKSQRVLTFCDGQTDGQGDPLVTLFFGKGDTKTQYSIHCTFLSINVFFWLSIIYRHQNVSLNTIYFCTDFNNKDSSNITLKNDNLLNTYVLHSFSLVPVLVGPRWIRVQHVFPRAVLSN